MEALPPLWGEKVCTHMHKPGVKTSLPIFYLSFGRKRITFLMYMRVLLYSVTMEGSNEYHVLPLRARAPSGLER